MELRTLDRIEALDLRPHFLMPLGNGGRSKDPASATRRGFRWDTRGGKFPPPHGINSGWVTGSTSKLYGSVSGSTSGSGPTRTRASASKKSGYEGRAENICSP
jgi:hypothetical protein